RVMNRLELVAETRRAALNALATVAPDWLQALAPLAWYERSSKRIEDTRLPQSTASRDAYAQTVGEDGFHLLEALDVQAHTLVIDMETVQQRPVTWLWYPYIAIGKICILDGDPGVGKTLF